MIVLLLMVIVVISVLFYLQPNLNTNNEIPLAIQKKKNIALLTGGENTPATYAKIHDAIEISEEWRLQHFQTKTEVLNKDGVCIKVSVCTSTADPDSDGVTNLKEYQYGTDPNLSDTDQDTLSDNIELFVYYTSPVDKDSDNDSVDDFTELLSCSDPIFKGQQLTRDRLAMISNSIQLYPMKTPSITIFKKNNATDEDITSKGYFQNLCSGIVD